MQVVTATMASQLSCIAQALLSVIGQVSMTALVNSLLEAGSKVIAVALHLPYDLSSYPGAPTYICTYNLQSPSMEAPADALWGRIPFLGRLPVTVAFG